MLPIVLNFLSQVRARIQLTNPLRQRLPNVANCIRLLDAGRMHMVTVRSDMNVLDRLIDVNFGWETLLFRKEKLRKGRYINLSQ